MRASFFGLSCSLLAALAVASAPGCGEDGNGSEFDGGGGGDGGVEGVPEGGFVDGAGPDGPCEGLGCFKVDCPNGGTTSLSGKVLDPAGKVPIYNAFVYVPTDVKLVAPLPEGASCDRCDAKLTGKPVALTTSDTSGAFKLDNVPVGDKIPLVIQLGKWRRIVEVAVPQCVDTPLDAGNTRLPRSRAEGNIPRIALTTGAADPLQCLLRKIGLVDPEFGVAGSDARVHLYKGAGYTDTGTGTVYNPSGQFAGGPAFKDAETLWGSVAELKKYDVVLMSCEGAPNDGADHKPGPAKQALYDYTREGGRVFASHYHHTFFSGSPVAAVKAVATWAPFPEPIPPGAPDPATTGVPATISDKFQKAKDMKEWLTKQNALDAQGKLPIFDARQNVNAVGSTALDWMSVVNTKNGNAVATQYMTFNTPLPPLGQPPSDDVCGRVVFSNLHVGAGEENGKRDDPTKPFPASCETLELSAQQKALEFMLFDLSSCVQKDDKPPIIPR